MNLNDNLQEDLKKVIFFLEHQDWSNYFFNLQNIMHKELIIFLNWKNKSLNYLAYSKVLTKKLKDFLNEKTINKYINIIQTINFYRNNISKASAEKLLLRDIFFNSSLDEQNIIAWEIYFDLLKLIKLIISLNNKN